MIIQLLEIYDNIFVVNINTVMNEVFSTLCDDQWTRSICVSYIHTDEYGDCQALTLDNI